MEDPKESRKKAAEAVFKEFHKRELPNEKVFCPPELVTQVQPKKLVNPVLDSKNHRQMQQEIKINKKLGINVLNQKSELSKKFQSLKMEKKTTTSDKLSEFEQMINKRRLDIEEAEQEEEKKEKLPEFLKIKQGLNKSTKNA